MLFVCAELKKKADIIRACHNHSYSLYLLISSQWIHFNNVFHLCLQLKFQIWTGRLSAIGILLMHQMAPVNQIVNSGDLRQVQQIHSKRNYTNKGFLKNGCCCFSYMCSTNLFVLFRSSKKTQPRMRLLSWQKCSEQGEFLKCYCSSSKLKETSSHL